MAVYVSNDVEPHEIPSFSVVDASTGETVYASRPEDVRNTGVMGELKTTVRLDFSALTAEGNYFIVAGGSKSSVVRISAEAYDGAADFVLNYMRQQRCGWNPFIEYLPRQGRLHSLSSYKGGAVDRRARGMA